MSYHNALSQNTFYDPWIESFQDSWWDPEFPQLSQMVQSLPGFLNLCLNVCSPCQVLGDVYTEVLEATHPLHRGPTDHKRSVGLLLSLPEVHDQLFSFAHVQRETGVLAPWCKSLYLFTGNKNNYFTFRVFRLFVTWQTQWRNHVWPITSDFWSALSKTFSPYTNPKQKDTFESIPNLGIQF